MSVLAMDLGATSGRAAIGHFDGTHLAVREIARFPNDPVRNGPRMEWDIAELFGHVSCSLSCAHAAAPDLESAAIVSWGLDFGLIDTHGALIQPARHYRDHRHESGVRYVDARIPRAELFRQTGIQHMRFNSLYHLAAMVEEPDRPLERAAALLQIADLIGYRLTGVRQNEYTNATTTQLIDLATGSWQWGFMDRLAIPRHLVLPPVTSPVPAAQIVAAGLPSLPLVTVASHDTASAVVAIPSTEPIAFVSCGTWSLLGTELAGPIVTADAARFNFSNEGGYGGTIRLLRNIMGLWMVEECRRAWQRQGHDAAHKDLLAAARLAPPLDSWIDPDAPEFEAPDDMPTTICVWLLASGQQVPENEGGLIRVILESLALKYRYTLDLLEQTVGHRFGALHVVGGGCRNSLLCQLTANAIGRPVLAGPAEATTIGNVLVQLIHAGVLASVDEAREVMRRSWTPVPYWPTEEKAWRERYEAFTVLMNRSEQIFQETR
jgi:rhamnulokinase